MPTLKIPMKFPRGTQVIYIPDHLKHLDPTDSNNYHAYGLSPGFITSGPRDGMYYVRYWNTCYASPSNWELRTKANSEETSFRNLVVMDTVPQEMVTKALKEYC